MYSILFIFCFFRRIIIIIYLPPLLLFIAIINATITTTNNNTLLANICFLSDLIFLLFFIINLYAFNKKKILIGGKDHRENCMYMVNQKVSNNY